MHGRWPSLIKLFAVCTILWVQALQAEHGVDQAFDSQHSDCVVCKNIADPIGTAGGAPVLAPNEYQTDHVSVSGFQFSEASVDLSHPVRAPPVSA